MVSDAQYKLLDLTTALSLSSAQPNSSKLFMSYAEADSKSQTGTSPSGALCSAQDKCHHQSLVRTSSLTRPLESTCDSPLAACIQPAMQPLPETQHISNKVVVRCSGAAARAAAAASVSISEECFGAANTMPDGVSKALTSPYGHL